MATFITTLKFTAQGSQNIRESPRRAAAFTASAKKRGLRIVGLYWTLGSFDGVLIFEASDEQIAAAMLGLASEGNVQPTTVRAFDAAEIETIVGILEQK